MSLLFSIPASFADEDLPLDADGAEILSETFKILSLKEMKLQAVTAGGTAGEELEEENMAKAVLQAAQKKVLSQVRRSGQKAFKRSRREMKKPVDEFLFLLNIQ